MPTIAELARRLATGTTTARHLIESALERIEDPAGEGARTFIQVSADTARAQADAIDRQRAGGRSLPPWAGIPIAIKDLFDIKAEVTRAGSRILENAPPARDDAPAVARLRNAGFIPIGRTNMTEFAYSGLGLNPHYGTPLNPFDRGTGRIPGGSTSGGAVAITDGMAVASLGTDTGGSCRIPAALTGIVGFKPTAERVPREGAIPLSPTLDSVGPLAASVACCTTLDAILRDAPVHQLEPAPRLAVKDLQLWLPTTIVLEDMDAMVARAFERAVDELGRAGAVIRHCPVYEFEVIPDINIKGGLAAAEAYAWHHRYLRQYAERYDPRVIARILKGQEPNAEELAQMRQARSRLIESFNATTRECQALILPTVPIIAPTLTALVRDEDYVRLNMLILRNPALANFLDGCGISLPIHEPGEAPVGLMLIGRHGEDAQLLALAAAIEQALGRSAARP